MLLFQCLLSQLSGGQPPLLSTALGGEGDAEGDGAVDGGGDTAEGDQTAAAVDAADDGSFGVDVDR